MARAERERAYTPAEARLQACHIVGRLMELWGFRKSLGRIWALLFLGDGPMCAAEIAESLSISRGSASMALQELLRWGVVRKSWKPGERKDFFEAEQDVAKMVLRVLNERELPAINEAIAGLRGVLSTLESERTGDEALLRRTRDLLGITETGRALFDGLVGPESPAVPPWGVLRGGREERS
jgi:DNA-binding transcriptional regulator GbsR (MarR family)